MQKQNRPQQTGRIMNKTMKIITVVLVAVAVAMSYVYAADTCYRNKLILCGGEQGECPQTVNDPYCTEGQDGTFLYGYYYGYDNTRLYPTGFNTHTYGWLTCNCIYTYWSPSHQQMWSNQCASYNFNDDSAQGGSCP